MPVYKEAVMLKMHRDFTVRTLLGYTYVFKKDVALQVAPQVVEDCMKCGAFPVNDEDLKKIEETPKEEVALAGSERVAAIYEAIETLVARNARGDFTANSSPHTAALSKLLGFDVKAKERDQVWDKVLKKDAGEKSN